MTFSMRMKGRILEKVVEYLLAEPVVETGGSQRSPEDRLEIADRAEPRFWKVWGKLYNHLGRGAGFGQSNLRSPCCAKFIAAYQFLCHTMLGKRKQQYAIVAEGTCPIVQRRTKIFRNSGGHRGGSKFGAYWSFT